MTKANGVNHTNLMVLILSNLIRAKTAKILCPRTLENGGNVVLLSVVIIEIVCHLSHRLIGSSHYKLIDSVKFTRIFLCELLSSFVNGSPYHDDLRVKAHVKLIAKFNSPIKGCSKIIRKRLVNDLFHHLFSRLTNKFSAIHHKFICDIGRNFH